MSDWTTKLDVDDERRNLWYQILRGLFGCIHILNRYKCGWTTGAPTNELRRAAAALSRIADECEEMKIHDPNQPVFEFKV